MKLLIVDDSKAMRMIIVRTLKQAGFSGDQTIEASNGAEALGILEREKPDLILSDWNMPEMKGIELLRKVRESGNTVRFGFITSESGPAVRQAAEEAGAVFVITKPFTPQIFEVAMGAVLN